MSTKYIMTRSLHLGNIKESFSAGTIIERLETSVFIDGKTYQSTKDLDILIKHKWAVPYSKEALDTVIQNKPLPIVKEKIDKTDNNKILPIVESDSDTYEEIDIKHTKTAKKEYPSKDKNKKLEVIAGDEPAEENLARVNAAKMPIVEDDGTLGRGVGKEPALNAGMVKVPKVDSATVEAQKNARKAALEAARAKRATEEMIQTPEQASDDSSGGETAEVAINKAEKNEPEPKEMKENVSPVKVTISNDDIEILETAATPNMTANKGRRGRPKGAKNKITQSETIPAAFEIPA